ncbi:non-homologous end-joining DNA ligase [Caulobacter sp. 1776]|uniref:non-homologous end-joining DNA ligase n=1 Tax=Caulobacter sp. 1776 TaxID=3156420 RepID=UPI003394E588
MAAKKRIQGSAVPMPDFVPFQHPKLVSEPPAGDNWIHEIKFDGYRQQIRVEHGRATIWSRNGNDFTDQLRALEAMAGELPDCILDGELVALGPKGEPSFSALRSALARRATDDLVFYAFDILFEGRNNDLRPYPLSTRKARLRHVLSEGGEHIENAIRFVEPLAGPPKALLRAACELKWEGIVSKRLDAPYVGDKVDTWRKAKCRPGIEVIIGGWTADGSRFDRILCGLPEPGGGLRYVGSVAPNQAPDLARRLRAIEEAASPFTAGPAPKKSSEVHWARPELVADIDIAEFTASGKMRQASFQRLRLDKTAADINPDVGT